MNGVFKYRIKNRNQTLFSNNPTQKMSIILAVYVVIQILVLSSLMIMQIDLAIHSITMSLSCIAYFVVAFKNPGYFQGEEKTAPSLSDEIEKECQVPSDQKIIKEMDEEEEEGNEKSDVIKGNNNDIALEQRRKVQIQKEEQLRADSFLRKPSQADDKIDQKLIKNKFPQHAFKKKQTLQKLSQIKSLQLDFILKKSSTQTPHRYCRICKTFQPYRVRHCHECQKCILTFDHHCPWMNNCIGERNRNVFWCYLMVQFVEFLLVLVDVGGKAREVQQDKARIYFFAVALLFVTGVAFALLAFHTFLMVKNFTTWEYVRWDRINYLAVYSYKKISPFSYGFVRNVTDYFVPGKIPKQWTINPEFIKINKEHEQSLKKTIQEKQIIQKPKLKTKVKEKALTQRAIISPNYP